MKWGGEAVYRQAEALAKRGAVLKAEMKDNWITGVIARDGGGEIFTKLRVIAPDRIESRCPCFTNREHGQVCLHVVALGITLMLRHSDPLREQKHIEDQRRANRIAQAEAHLFRRDRFGIRAQLALTLAPGWVEAFRKGQVAVSLVLLTDDGFILPEQITQEESFAFSDEDNNLLMVLEDICEGPPKDTITLAALDFLNVLAISSHTRIAVAGGSELTVHPQKVTAHLQITLDRETGNLTVAPQVDAPVPSGVRPVWLAYLHTGWVLLGNGLHPLKNVLPGPYHSIYLADEVIPRERVMTFLKRDLPALQAVIPVEMEPPPDLFVEIPATPLFRLDVQGSRAALRARLSAVYGEQSFAAAMPYAQAEFAIPDPDDILTYRTRNMASSRIRIFFCMEKDRRSR